MRGLWLAVLATAWGAAAWAAPAGKLTEKPDEKASVMADDKMLLATPTVQWLKVYSLPIYKERWRVEGSVPSLETDLPKLRQVFSRAGAALVGGVEPAEAGRARKLSYRCSQKTAKAALRELKKLGAFAEPSVRPILEPVSAAEVRHKISALEADKAAHGAELQKMPAVAALVDEMLGHLRGVESSLRKTEVEVLIHLTVKEKG